MKPRALYRSVAAALLALTATGVPAPPAAAAPSGPDALSWTDCGDRLQCASVEVPLDYANPAAGTIRVGLNRLPATGPDSAGAVVVNAGTQDGGGASFVRYFTAAFTEINRHFDVIGLDTRGVGSSEPLVRCTTHEENRVLEAPVSAAQTVADRDDRVREATALAAVCRERSGALLPHLSSTTSARDLDRVRAALGEEQLRFVGFSAGAVLGQNYLRLFPDRVAAMVLDSPYDAARFAGRPFAFDIDQMLATERAMDVFFAWCRDEADLCTFGGDDPRAAFERLLAKTRQVRLDHPGRWDVVTDGALVDLISGAMLFPQRWPEIGRQLAALDAQPVPTRPLATGDDRGFAEYYSQTCLDRRFPDALAAYDRQLRAAVRATRYLGGRYGYAELKCRFWPVTAAERTDGPWLNPHRRPVLVVAATADPLAPYRDAASLAGRLGAGLITLDATGHLQTGRSACADAVTAAFLLTGRSPARTGCAVPLPGR